MPREITPRPATQPTPPTVVRQHIDRVMIEAGIDPITLNIDETKTILSVDVRELMSDGTDGARQRYSYTLAQWPTVLRTDIVSLRNTLLTLGESLGILEPGTDSGEIT